MYVRASSVTQAPIPPIRDTTASIELFDSEKDFSLPTSPGLGERHEFYRDAEVDARGGVDVSANEPSTSHSHLYADLHVCAHSNGRGGSSAHQPQIPQAHAPIQPNMHASQHIQEHLISECEFYRNKVKQLEQALALKSDEIKTFQDRINDSKEENAFLNNLVNMYKSERTTVDLKRKTNEHLQDEEKTEMVKLFNLSSNLCAKLHKYEESNLDRHIQIQKMLNYIQIQKEQQTKVFETEMLVWQNERAELIRIIQRLQIDSKSKEEKFQFEAKLSSIKERQYVKLVEEKEKILRETQVENRKRLMHFNLQNEEEKSMLMQQFLEERTKVIQDNLQLQSALSEQQMYIEYLQNDIKPHLPTG